MLQDTGNIAYENGKLEQKFNFTGTCVGALRKVPNVFSPKDHIHQINDNWVAISETKPNCVA